MVGRALFFCPVAAIFLLACFSAPAPRAGMSSVAPPASPELSVVVAATYAAAHAVQCGEVGVVRRPSPAPRFDIEACGRAISVSLYSWGDGVACFLTTPEAAGSDVRCLDAQTGAPLTPAEATRRHQIAAPASTSSSGSVHVRGYRRRDGTYVRPHTRRRPR